MVKKTTARFMGFLCCLAAMSACNTGSSSIVKTGVDLAFIDSVKALADTSYTKQQYTANFALATYYKDTAADVLMQIMMGKDSAVKQVSVTRQGKRIYFAQYYDNGQLRGLYNFDSYGSNDGASKEFFENGAVKEAGLYKSGFRTGEWTIFDSTGKQIEKVAYDANGQQVVGGGH